jgi:hypothetical protein
VSQYPCAITPGAEDKSGAVRLGVRWILRQQRELGGEILLDVPNAYVLSEWQGVSALAKMPNVRVSKRGRGFPNGPVLAVWPTAKAFTELLSHDHDIRAMCLLPWQAPTSPLPWVTAWANGSKAELLGEAFVPSGNVGLDRAVRAGLESLAGNLGGTLGYGMVKSTIKILADARLAMPPEQVRAHMLEKGCRPEDAAEAYKLCQRVAAGVKLRWPEVGRMDPAILREWSQRNRT